MRPKTPHLVGRGCSQHKIKRAGKFNRSIFLSFFRDPESHYALFKQGNYRMAKRKNDGVKITGQLAMKIRSVWE
jgi:hypothetical protein